MESLTGLLLFFLVRGPRPFRFAPRPRDPFPLNNTVNFMANNSLPKHVLDELQLGIDYDRFRQGKRPLRTDGKPNGVFLWKALNDERGAKRAAAHSPQMRREFDHARRMTERGDVAAYGGRAPRPQTRGPWSA